MSVSLTLVPEVPHFVFPGMTLLAYTRLPLAYGDYALWQKLEEVGRPLPEKVHWYEDDGLRLRDTTPYGKALKFLYAGELWQFFNELEFLRPWDRAVVGFIRALPAKTRVVLWFH